MTPRELFEIVLAADVGARPRLWCESIASAESIVRSGTLSLQDLTSNPPPAHFAATAAIVPSVAGWLLYYQERRVLESAIIVHPGAVDLAVATLLEQARMIAELRAKLAPSVPVGGGPVGGG